MQPSPLLARSLMADQTHCPLCKGPLGRRRFWCHMCYNFFATAKDWTKNFSSKSCSEITAANETANATPAPHNDLTVPDTALINLATSHAPEHSVAESRDNFWDNFQRHHAVTAREIYRKIVTWKPLFLK